jgi:uncharacterized protein (DUF849 family)
VALVATAEAELSTAAPRLGHGDGAATWVLLRAAVERGWDTRIGLEDTREAPNPELVKRAMSLIRAEGH